jgi:hypothetical protein
MSLNPVWIIIRPVLAKCPDRYSVARLVAQFIPNARLTDWRQNVYCGGSKLRKPNL